MHKHRINDAEEPSLQEKHMSMDIVKIRLGQAIEKKWKVDKLGLGVGEEGSSSWMDFYVDILLKKQNAPYIYQKKNLVPLF